LLYIVLLVSISVKDQILRAICEPGDQSSTVPTVDTVVDDLQERAFSRQNAQEIPGPIDGPVIHHDDLIIIGDSWQQPSHRMDDPADGTNIIVGRKECGYGVSLIVHAREPQNRLQLHPGDPSALSLL
jgi:hypothetical protein